MKIYVKFEQRYGPRITIDKSKVTSFVRFTMDTLSIWGGPDKSTNTTLSWEFDEKNIKFNGRIFTVIEFAEHLNNIFNFQEESK